MDEGTGEERQAVDAPGDAGGQKSPEEIRREIDETRAELGDTVEVLAEKADVKGQAQERISDLKRTAQQKKDEFVAKAKASSPDSASAGAQQVSQKAQENPIPLAVGGAFLAGFLIGRRSAR